MKFKAANGFEGKVKLEGFLWWKKWKAYLQIDNSLILIDILLGKLSKQEVKKIIEKNILELVFIKREENLSFLLTLTLK
jgi:hypothetical protein